MIDRDKLAGELRAACADYAHASAAYSLTGTRAVSIYYERWLAATQRVGGLLAQLGLDNLDELDDRNQLWALGFAAFHFRLSLGGLHRTELDAEAMRKRIEKEPGRYHGGHLLIINEETLRYLGAAWRDWFDGAGLAGLEVPELGEGDVSLVERSKSESPLDLTWPSAPLEYATVWGSVQYVLRERQHMGLLFGARPAVRALAEDAVYGIADACVRQWHRGKKGPRLSEYGLDVIHALARLGPGRSEPAGKTKGGVERLRASSIVVAADRAGETGAGSFPDVLLALALEVRA